MTSSLEICTLFMERPRWVQRSPKVLGDWSQSNTRDTQVPGSAQCQGSTAFPGAPGWHQGLELCVRSGPSPRGVGTLRASALTSRADDPGCPQEGRGILSSRAPVNVFLSCSELHSQSVHSLWTSVLQSRGSIVTCPTFLEVGRGPLAGTGQMEVQGWCSRTRPADTDVLPSTKGRP